jgi:hypothetical protein
VSGSPPFGHGRPAGCRAFVDAAFCVSSGAVLVLAVVGASICGAYGRADWSDGAAFAMIARAVCVPVRSANHARDAAGRREPSPEGS